MNCSRDYDQVESRRTAGWDRLKWLFGEEDYKHQIRHHHFKMQQ